tara:strand:- start:1135 stop:1641 length:507 start_codon:yes stop_codon:yes gene_type:complete
MKKFILLSLSLLILSCGQKYVEQSNLEVSEGIHTLYGEKFDGVSVRLDRKNRVSLLRTYEDGYIMSREQYYNHHEVDFKWVELDNGKNIKISNIKSYYKDFEISYQYYSDGSYRIISENGIHPSEDPIMINVVRNGKTEYFDLEGKLTGTEYYKYGELYKTDGYSPDM